MVEPVKFSIDVKRLVPIGNVELGSKVDCNDVRLRRCELRLKCLLPGVEIRSDQKGGTAGGKLRAAGVI